MKELDKKHKDEQEILLNVLMDESLPELIEAAQMMTDEEKQKRLMELQGKRRSLNLDMPGTSYIIEQDNQTSVNSGIHGT